MLDIRESDLRIEVKNPSTSFNNISILKQLHGDIVGVCHCTDGEKQTTQIVFFDGYIHESNGFLIKKCESETDQMSLLGLLLAINMIPGLGPSCEKIMQEYIEKEITKLTYFIFKIGYSFLPSNNIYKNCSGHKVLNELIEFILMEDNVDIVEATP